jgi:hypothetical protein
MLFTQWIINATEVTAHLLQEINLIPVTGHPDNSEDLFVSAR